MGQELVPSRPVSQSLFGAANAVEAASDHDAVADAVREASVAVEYHLDTLARELSSRTRGIDPGFRFRAEAVERQLREALAACWAHQRLSPAEAVDRAGLTSLAREIRKVASEETDLVFDQLNAPPALD